MARISIVVPAHNEEQNLPSLLEAHDALRRQQKWDCEFVIVDDNSSDNTGKVADALAKKYAKVKVLHRNLNPGMGNALKDGTKLASGSIIIWAMADKSDDPATFPKMVAMVDAGYDMVFGSRYIKGGSRGDLAMHKALLSWGYSFTARLIAGIKVHDITNAFRCFKKEVFTSLKIESGDFAISPEFALKAHKAGYKLGEVPTVYADRKAGKTTFKILKMGSRYVSMFRFIFSK